MNYFCPGSVNTYWGPGPVNTNWGPGLVNTNWGPGPEAGGQGQGWGPSKGPGAGKYKYPLRYMNFHLFQILILKNFVSFLMQS